MKNSIKTGMAAVADDNTLWLVTTNTDSLLEIDICTWRVISTYQIPTDSIVQYSHVVMNKIRDDLFIFPLYGKGIFKFNIDKKEFERLSLKCDNAEIEPRVRIAERTMDDKIVFIDCDKNYIYEYDVQNNKIQRVDEKVLQELNARKVDISSPVFFWQHLCVDDKMYLPLYNNNKFVVFDMKTHDNRVFEFEKGVELRYIGGDSQKIIFSTSDSTLIVWNPKSGKELYRWKNEDDSKDLYPFSFGDKEVLLPFCQRRIMIKEGDDIRQIDIPVEISDYDPFPETECSQFEAIFIKGGKLFVQTRIDGDLYCIDSVSGIVEKLVLEYPDENKNNAMREVLQNSSGLILCETKEFNLSNYINAL